MNNRTRAFTIMELLAIFAILAVIATILVKACVGSGPLTKANGRTAADAVFRQIAQYVAGGGQTSGLGEYINPKITEAIDAIKTREGAADFAAGFCA